MGSSILQQLGRQQLEQAQPPAGKLNTNLALTEQRNVAELNEADELARLLAIPREMVLGNIAQARAKAAGLKANKLATQAPVSAEWAGKTPERTAISQPSWDNLNRIERIFGKREALEPRSGIEMPGRELLQPTRPISRGIVSATISKSLLNSDLNRMYYNTTWNGRNTPEFKRKEREILDQIGAIQAPQAEGALETMFESAAQFTGSRITGSAAGASVAGVATVGALAVGAPVAAVAGTAFGLGTLVRGIAEQSGADIRANNSVPNADPVVSDLSGRFSGLVSGSIDYLATKYLAGIFGSAYKKVVGNATAKVLQSPSTRQALVNGVKAWGSSIAVETLTETTQQAISLASEQVVRSAADAPAIELERVGRELFETALTTAAGMLILGVPGGAVTTIADLGKVESAKERQAFMSALGDEVKATSLSTTSPSEFKSFAEEVVQMYGPVQNILIPIERFKAYWQEQNVDPRIVAGEIVPDIAAYDEAVSTGGDLVIPLANYVASVAPTEHHAELLQDVRFRPDDITFREAKEMEAKVAEDLDGLRKDIAEAAESTPTEESAKRVVDDIAARLTATGKYTPDVVATQAQVAAAFYIGTARRAKLDPWQLYQSRNINILGPVQAERLYDAIAEMEAELAADPTSPAAQESIKRVEEIRAEIDQLPGGAEVTQRALTPMVMPISAVDVGQRVVLEDSRSAVVTGRGDGNVTVRIAGGETRTIAGDREVQVPGAVLRQARIAFVEQPVVPETVDAVSNVEAAFAFAESQQFRKNRDFKVAIQDRVRAAAAEAGVDLTQFSPEVEKYLVRMGIMDARTALRTNANAVGWYNEKVTKALRVMSLIHPELATDANAKFAFVWAMAVTSNGLKVDKNFELANSVYSRFREDGVMPTNLGIGKASIAINESLQLYNDLVAQYGIQKVIDFFTSMHTVKEVQEFTGKEVSGENLGTEVFGAAALGPKIGNGFFMNLYGEFGQLTMDRWFIRTWGRWNGKLVVDSAKNAAKKGLQLEQLLQLLTESDKAKLQQFVKVDVNAVTMEQLGEAIAKVSVSKQVREGIALIAPITADFEQGLVDILGPVKGKKPRISIGDEIRKVGNALSGYLDGQIESPSGPPERGRMRQVMRQVLAALKPEYPALTMADLQALLWYPEKRLYDAAKTLDEAAMVGYEDTAAPDYANAAVKLALAQNVPQDDITNTLTEVDNELGAGAAAAADVGAGGAGRAVRDGVLRPTAGEGAATAQPGTVGPQILRQSVTVSDESVSRLLDRAVDPDYVFVELPETIEVDGVQRPTRNNKGQQIARDATGVKNFWRWFGDSKLVDEQGRPVVIYHGTEATFDFGEFKPNISELGVHIGTTEQANRFAQGIARVSEDAGGRVFPLYAKLQNPIRLRDRGGFSARRNVLDQLVNLGLMTLEERNSIVWPEDAKYLRTDKQIEEATSSWLKNKGYDGVVYLNRFEGYPEELIESDEFKENSDLRRSTDAEWVDAFGDFAQDSYIVFNANQLKSTSNIGSFSRVRDILRQVPSEPVPSDGAAPSPVSRNVADAAAIFGEGRFSVVTGLEETTRRKFFGTKANTWAEVAAGMSALARGADERFDVLLTDAKGKPISIVAGSKGGIDFAAVPVNSVVFDIVRTPGAAKAWFVHNHPSGYTGLSSEDKSISEQLANLLQGSGVEPKGIMAVGFLQDGTVQYEYQNTESTTPIGGIVDVPAKSKPIPFFERQIQQRTPVLSPPIVGLGDALRAVETVANGRDGLLMLNTKGEAVGFVELTEGDVKKLRYSPEMRKIQEGAALVNANFYIVVARGWGSRELNNIQRFINAFNPGNLSLYDIIDPEGAGTSARAAGQLLKPTETVFRQAQQARPNAFIMPGVSRTTIGLMRTANLSSLMHEFSHDYLNLLFDVAAMPEATDQIRADAELVLKYFNVEDPSQITVENQETWARMFESYLMEGKAPSKELQSAFGRFRVWLSAIYRAITNALVPVSPEIRGVFDRMLASDEQIAEAVQQDELGPLFESASEAGMSEAEFKAYREAVTARDEQAKRTLMVRLMEEQNKERRQFWKDREAEVRQTVTEQVAMEPVQQVVHFLKTGTLLSGETLPEDVTPYKLSKALLVSRYGPDVVKSIPRGTYSVEGGVDPDVVALSFGFDSGDAMITQMQAFEPRQARIDRIVKETMAAEFPDLLNDSPALAEAAQDAVHQAPSDQLLYAELVKLGKLDAMIPPTNLFAVRQAAKEIIAKTRIRDLVPDRFRRAEAKAGRLAYQAMRQGDRVKAAFHKRQQLLNHLLYREATASIELANKAYKFFGKMAKGEYQQRLGKAGREYLEQMNALLDQYDFSRISGAEAERRMALSEWAAAQVARGVPVEIPASVLYNTQRTNYRLLTVEQLQGVYDTGRQIYHVARNENKLLAAAAKASFQETVDGIVAGIGAQHKIEPREPDYAPSKLRAVANALKKLDAWHVKPEFLFRWLDGDKAFGPVHQALFEPIAQAENAESAMVLEANKRVEALFNLIPKDRRKQYLSRRIQVPGVSTRMTGATALSMALNWGNSSNREALLEGTIADRPVFTPQQVDAVLRTLTRAEWDFVQGVWDYINEFWPQIAELQRSLTGVAPEKIEAEAFTVTTADGETINLRGGYYPLAYDQNYNWAQFKQDMAADVKDLGANSYTRAATKHGFTESRVGSGGRPVKLDLSVFSEHVLNVIHDLTHRKAIIDVQRLAENAEVREAIEGTAGRDLYRTIRPWLVRIAGDRRPPASPIEDLVGRARTGVTVVNMGLKVTTAIVQPIGYLQSLDMLGANYGRRGLTAFFANPAKLTSWVKEQSVALRTRQQSFDRDVRDQTKRLLKKGPLTRAQESFFFFTGLMDMAVAVPTWYGAYLKSLETLKPGDHHAAVTYADSVVRMTQGSGAAKDLSQIQGGGELQRSFTVFYTYFNALYNLLRRSGALLKDRGPRDTGRFLASMAVLWFLPAVMSELIAGRGPDEEDDEDAMQWALWKMLKYPFSTVVGVRDIASAIGPEAYDYELSPVVSAGRSVVESINAIGRATGEAFQGDGFELTEGEVKQFLMAIGYWGQLPSRQMWITGSYLYDWMMGYEEPEEPAEVFRGLAFPRQK